MALIALDAHNRAASVRYWGDLDCNAMDGRAHLNGIACPECGSELVDTQPNVQLTSAPPQKSVACLDCGWSGYRVDA